MGTLDHAWPTCRANFSAIEAMDKYHIEKVRGNRCRGWFIVVGRHANGLQDIAQYIKKEVGSSHSTLQV